MPPTNNQKSDKSGKKGLTIYTILYCLYLFSVCISVLDIHTNSIDDCYLSIYWMHLQGARGSTPPCPLPWTAAAATAAPLPPLSPTLAEPVQWMTSTLMQALCAPLPVKAPCMPATLRSTTPRALSSSVFGSLYCVSVIAQTLTA